MEIDENIVNVRNNLSRGIISAMLKRNWHIGLTIGMALYASIGHAESANHTDRKRENTIVNIEASASEVSLRSAQNSYVYPYSCYTLKDAEQDNLCIEQRSAKADEDSAYWTQATFWLGALGTIAVVVTLILGIMQNELARRAYLADHRPRIRFWHARIGEIFGEEKIHCQIVLINTGASCAKEVCGNLSLVIRRAYETKLFPSENISICDTLNVSQDKVIDWEPRFRFPLDSAIEIRSGAAQLDIVGSIFYKDENEVVRRTAIHRTYDRLTGHFIRHPEGHQYAQNDFEA